MSDKKRVKDLAAEMGLGNKDLLQMLRDLEIPVKSLMSSLDEEQIAEVKQYASQEEETSSEVIRKEVQPGVIVRRRKRAGKERRTRKAAEAPEAEAPAEATVEPEEAPVPAEPREPVKKPAAPVAEEPETAPEPQPEPEETAPAEPTAKIIKPKDAQPPVEKTEEPPVEAPEETAAEEEPEPEAPTPAEEEAPAGPEEVEEPAEEVAAAPAEEEAPEEEVEEEPEPKAKKGKKRARSKEDEEAEEEKPRKRKKKREREPSGPQVKVIHKPDKPEPTPRPAAKPEEGAPARKRRKDRRVVDFKSMPPEQPPAAARPGGKPGRRPPKKREEPGRGKSPRPKGKPMPRHVEEEMRQHAMRAEKQEPTTAPRKAAKRKIKIDEAIRVSDLAHQMGIKATEIIKVLMGLGVMATINQSLDIETATVIANEFGYEIESVGFSEDEFLIPAEPDKKEDLKPRPPVVTIMGHVDHGKTSLLDAIRESKITSDEAGGITQHIGAYHVQTERGEIVFLDTPGHEAFTAMRMRGAQVTDIVILVVAADDGVKDQTREAISHSKAAGVPIVVAVNKMDKDGADPDRVRRELAELGLQPEDWGGDTIFAHVSAKMHEGLDELLELVLLQAEVLELSSNPEKPARGHIVEAKLDKGRGPVATVLIEEGTLKQGESFVCGLFSGKVRAMFNDKGAKIDEAGPAIPAEVQGFDGVPMAGDEFVVVTDDKVARRIAEDRTMKQRERELAKETKVTLESFLASRADQEVKTLNVVLKADVQGSLEAIQDALVKLSTDEVKISIIHAGAGAITESDILLASASDAIIIGFNVRPTVKVKEMAEAEQVDIRFYDIIYKLVGEIKDAMSGMLAPVIRESYLGQAEVRETFSVSRAGTIAGCGVIDGKLTRNAQVRLLRDGVVIHTGKLDSLKRFKDDAKEVTKGYECGLHVAGFNDIKIGDIIEAFEEVEETRTME